MTKGITSNWAGDLSKNDDIDISEIMSALKRRRKFILALTLLAFLASLIFVNMVSPKYTTESRLLLENQDSFFARPDKDLRLGPNIIDPEDVLSQVQLAQSSSLARAVIKKLNLAAVDEFDPVRKGVPAFTRFLVLFGLVKDPTTITPEDRVLENYSSKVSVFAVGKSRIISAEVTTQDPKLSASIANAITQQYLEQQTLAKKQTMQNGSSWLLNNMEPLRQKVIEADAKVEAFRTKSSLFIGTNNNTIANQQLSELNTQLSTARATQADQQSRARLIRQSLQSGRIFDFSEVLKDDLIRKLSENRSNLRALLASEERIYLPQHPRLKELTAQIADLEIQIRAAAERTARSLENDSRAASARVAGLVAEMEDQKKLSAQANEDDVQLKALEREAKTLRDQFDSYSAKANEATARDTHNPSTADARIVTVALPPSQPSFPKVLPIILLSTLAALLLSTVLTITGQLLQSNSTMPKEKTAVLNTSNTAFEHIDTSHTIDSQSSNTSDKLDLSARSPVSSSIQPVIDTALTNAGKLDKVSILETLKIPDEEIAVPAVLTSPQAKMVLYPQSTYAQGISALVERCRLLNNKQAAVTVLMMGNAPELGLTSAAISLVRELSKHGRAIIVDLNDQNPSLDQLTDKSEPDGLTDAFAAHITIGDAIYLDRGSKAHVMPFGYSDIGMSQSDDLHSLIDVLQKTYDYIVFDTGTLGGFEEIILASSDLAVIAVGKNETDLKISQLCSNVSATGAKSVTVLRCDLHNASIMEEAN